MHVQTRYDNNYDIKFIVHYFFLDSDTFIVKGAEKIARSIISCLCSIIWISVYSYSAPFWPYFSDTFFAISKCYLYQYF
jgi:hypothetical protein